MYACIFIYTCLVCVYMHTYMYICTHTHILTIINTTACISYDSHHYCHQGAAVHAALHARGGQVALGCAATFAPALQDLQIKYKIELPDY